MARNEISRRSVTTSDRARRVERALARAQELVDYEPDGTGLTPWYFEARQVRDLSPRALLPRRPLVGEEDPRGPEAGAS